MNHITAALLAAVQSSMTEYTSGKNNWDGRLNLNRLDHPSKAEHWGVMPGETGTDEHIMLANTPECLALYFELLNAGAPVPNYVTTADVLLGTGTAKIIAGFPEDDETLDSTEHEGKPALFVAVLIDGKWQWEIQS